jgi:hypothetical protein
MNLFQGCPIQVNLNVPVTTMISPDPIPVDYSESYDARLLPLHYQFDVVSGRKELILPLYSEKLMARFEHLLQSGVRPAYGDFYFPHLLLNADLPPVRHRYKSILNSLSDAFVTYQHEITLVEETVIAEDFDEQPSRAYYEDMIVASGLNGD